jgi:hypothetical protein
VCRGVVGRPTQGSCGTRWWLTFAMSEARKNGRVVSPADASKFTRSALGESCERSDGSASRPTDSPEASRVTHMCGRRSIVGT